MFEKASRKKLRFDSPAGALTAEQLWDLPLTGKTSLDSIAKQVNRKLKSAEEESFVETSSKDMTDDTLRLDILEHVIAERLKQQKTAVEQASKLEMRRRLERALDQRRDTELGAKSSEELLALIKDLED